MAGVFTKEELDLLHDIVARIAGMPDALRQAQSDRLWASIGEDNYEFAYSASQPANTALVVQPKTSSFFRVMSVVASIPSGATGTVQLADVVIPIPQGLTIIPYLRLQIAQADTRTVQGTIQGPMLLLLSGEQLPGAVGVVQTR